MYESSFRQTWRTQAISFIIVALHFMTCLAEKPCFQYVQKKKEKKGKKRSGENGILLPKLLRPTVRKKTCSSEREKLLKFEAEGQEFGKFLKDLFKL